MNLSVLMIVLLPIFMIVVMLVFVLVDRYIRYKERVALAQLGFSLEEIRNGALGSRGSRGVLWGGVITAMSGLALLVGLGTLGLGVWLLGGFLPLFVGVGMILIYFVTGETGVPPAQVQDMEGKALDAQVGNDPFEPTSDQATDDLVASILAAGPRGADPGDPGTGKVS